MKLKKNLIIATMLLASAAMAQVVPSGYSFQGVAREADGSPSKTKTIVVNVSLYNASSGGDAEWIQEFTPTTDNYGVFGIVIGSSDQPNKVVGGKTNLIDLDWNKKQYFAKVSQKIGGTYYDVNPVRTPLNAVPYAFAAQRVVEKQILSVKGDTLFLSDGGKVTLPKGFSGNYADLSGKPTNISTFTNDKNYLTTEADPTFNASLAKNIKATDTTRWNNKSSFSGNYADLSGKPTNISTFANDKNYLTTEADPAFNASLAKNIKATDTTRWATDNDKQQLSLTGNELSIANGNSVDLSTISLQAPSISTTFTKQLTGTVIGSANTKIINGGGSTLFMTELMPGMLVQVDKAIFRVDSIKDNDRIYVTPAITSTFANAIAKTEGTPLQIKNAKGDTLLSVTSQGRLKDKTGFVMPVGSVIAYFGETAPQGWMICNGASLNKSDYPELWKAIGCSTGCSEITFNIPDLRGLFLRGVDGPNHFDLDLNDRKTGYPGGNTGAKVGTYQLDAFQGHRHDIQIRYSSSVGINGVGLDQGYAFAPTTPGSVVLDPVSDGVDGSPRVAKETRPVNVYVNYIIKY